MSRHWWIKPCKICGAQFLQYHNQMAHYDAMHELVMWNIRNSIGHPFLIEPLNDTDEWLKTSCNHLADKYEVTERWSKHNSPHVHRQVTCPKCNRIIREDYEEFDRLPFVIL